MSLKDVVPVKVLPTSIARPPRTVMYRPHMAVDICLPTILFPTLGLWTSDAAVVDAVYSEVAGEIALAVEGEGTDGAAEGLGTVGCAVGFVATSDSSTGLDHAIGGDVGSGKVGGWSQWL